MDKMIKKLLVALITASLTFTGTSLAIFAEEVPDTDISETVSINKVRSLTTTRSALSGTVILTFDGTDISASDGNTYTAVQDSDGDYYLEIQDGNYVLKGTAESIYLSVSNGSTADVELSMLTVNNDGVKSAFITAAKSTTVNISLSGVSEVNGGAGFVSQKKSSSLNISGSVSYNGLKTGPDVFRINGQEAGTALSGNVIFKKIRLKQNKNVGEAYAIPVFRAARGSDSSTKKAVRTINKYFKSNPLTFNITACGLTDKTLSGSAAYNSKRDKWSFNLKTDTGASKLIKLKYKRDFTVVEDSYDAEKGTVLIQGCGNYSGLSELSGINEK